MKQMNSHCQLETGLFRVFENELVTYASNRLYGRIFQSHLFFEPGVEPLHSLVHGPVHHDSLLVVPGFGPQVLTADCLPDVVMEYSEDTSLQWRQRREQFLALDADVVLFNIHMDVLRSVFLSYCSVHWIHEPELLATDAAKPDNYVVRKLMLHERLNGDPVYSGAKRCPISKGSDVFYEQPVALSYDLGMHPGAVHKVALYNHAIRSWLTSYGYLTPVNSGQSACVLAIEVFKICVTIRARIVIVRHQIEPHKCVIISAQQNSTSGHRPRSPSG